MNGNSQSKAQAPKAAAPAEPWSAPAAPTQQPAPSVPSATPAAPQKEPEQPAEGAPDEDMRRREQASHEEITDMAYDAAGHTQSFAEAVEEEVLFLPCTISTGR